MSEDNYQKAIEYLSVFANIDLNDAKQRILLIRAIEYADISRYVPAPKSVEDSVYNEIFVEKATCHFRRKMLDMTDKNNIKLYRDIQEHEWGRVSRLKMRLPPSKLIFPQYKRK